MSSKEFKHILVDKLKEILKDLHFKKTGNIFHLNNGDLTYFVGLQSSQSSTSDVLKVTVNTEIRSALISKLDDTSIPIEHQRHYTRRIGSYITDRQDKWWSIDNFDSAATAANEISSIITDKVIPTFDSLKTTSDLVTFWRKGGFAGITESQQKKYLDLIEKASE